MTGRNKGKKKKQIAPSSKSYYPLDEVKELVSQGKVLIEPNALITALRDFGWETEDILDALSKLQRKHYYKTARFEKDIMIELDYYKARPLKEENVYIHFYIDPDDNMLIINSFKRCDEPKGYGRVI